MIEPVSPRKPARREGYSPAIVREGHPLLRPDEQRPLGIVLSGGGARGAFQAGVWKALCTHPRGLLEMPKVISGTSAGAINAMLIAFPPEPG